MATKKKAGPVFKYFDDAEAVLSYILSELEASLQDDLDRMTYAEHSDYTDEDRADMKNKLHDIKACEPFIRIK